MLGTKGKDLKDKIVAVSGSGNVAQYAVEKANQLGAKVITMSDSGGCIYDAHGIDAEKLAHIMYLKNELRTRISEYVVKYPNAKYLPDAKPWEQKCDIALPCATQNELDIESAKTLVANGCFCVAEGANMPSTYEAIVVFHDAKILFAPEKLQMRAELLLQV